MNLKPLEKHVNGETKRPMNRETLERLETQDKFASPIINAILFYRDLTKSLQVLETEIDPDWRWRCSYNIGGTVTGRWSSSKSPLGTGNNFQNINEELRRVFIPDPGFKLYGIDKAQSEARDVGWFCGTILGDWSYLDACESNDLHTFVTRLSYPEWAWTGDLKKDRVIAERRFYRFFTYRDVSKRVGHATNYMGQPREISKQTRLPLHIAEEFQERYFSAFPCIRRMHAWIASTLQRERFLVNSFGRRRDFFDRPDAHDTIKGAVAYMFQSATGDCLNLGLYRLWKNMGTEVQILSQLHDAVYFQFRERGEKEEMDLLERAVDCIQVPQKHGNRTMVIPGETVGGFNWAHRFRLREDGSLDDWNPRGLDKIKI
jgi:DNA polymerase-1